MSRSCWPKRRPKCRARAKIVESRECSSWLLIKLSSACCLVGRVGHAPRASLFRRFAARDPRALQGAVALNTSFFPTSTLPSREGPRGGSVTEQALMWLRPPFCWGSLGTIPLVRLLTLHLWKARICRIRSARYVRCFSTGGQQQHYSGQEQANKAERTFHTEIICSLPICFKPRCFSQQNKPIGQELKLLESATCGNRSSSSQSTSDFLLSIAHRVWPALANTRRFGLAVAQAAPW